MLFLESGKSLITDIFHRIQNLNLQMQPIPPYTDRISLCNISTVPFLPKVYHPFSLIVDRCLRIVCLREAELPIGAVVHGVKALEEGVAVDEVEALAGRGAQVGYDEVQTIRRATDRLVQRRRPQLGVRDELVGDLRIGADV